jgi:hypothetical protein
VQTTTLEIGEKSNWLEKIISSLTFHGEDVATSVSIEEMIDEAARRAFQISTALGLIPGPLGMATILPEVAALARLQISLIHRIAGHYGKGSKVNKELVLLIMANAMGLAAGEVLFRKVGTTLVLKSASTRIARTVARRVGTRMVDMAVGKAIGRWIPVITAPLFGCFSRSLTRKIGREAQNLFLQEIEIETAGLAT